MPRAGGRCHYYKYRKEMSYFLKSKRSVNYSIDRMAECQSGPRLGLSQLFRNPS